VTELGGPSCDDPAVEHEVAVAKEKVWRAVGELPEMESKVIRLHFHDGYTLREVAQILGVSLRTAKFHKARGLVLLHEKLARR
jgi:RNA polymerase sigma-70 factor (ECF subfamily)